MTVSFSVEGLDVNGRLAVIGFLDESGKSRNPCGTLEKAIAAKDEILELQKSNPKMAWRDIRIVKTTRETVDALDFGL